MAARRPSGARARPGSRRRLGGRYVRSGSVERGGLPAESGELPGARNGECRCACRAGREMGPARVQALLRAPCDGDDARVLADLAGGDRLADVGVVAVVVRGLDQEPAGCGGPALVIWPCTRLVSEVYSPGTIPRKPDSSAGLSNRSKLPISRTARPRSACRSPKTAQPRDRLGVAAPGAASSSAPINARRRCTSASTAQR